MSALRVSECSMSELANALGLKTRTGSIQRAVSELLAQGLIEYTLPDKPNSRLQKYRLTSRGRAILDPDECRGTHE